MPIIHPLNKTYFNNLDGLRFMLAIIVFFSHSLLGETLIKEISYSWINNIIGVFSRGSLAVSFFFTLSGYLITYLILEEKETTAKFSIRNFYVRRVLRIWPLYYLVLIFTFVVYPFIKVKLGYVNENPYHFLYQVFFLSNFDSIIVHEKGLVDVAPMMIGINWSIAIEEQFYLLWPLLFWITGSKRFWLIIILTIIVGWISSTYILHGIEVYYHTFSRASDLAIGALFAYLSFFSPDFIKKIKVMPVILISIIYLIGIIYLAYFNLNLPSWFPGSILNSLFFVFIILEQNFSDHSFYKFGDNKVLSSLGKYSYSLYLLHPLGIQVSILSFRFLSIDREAGLYFGILYAVIAFIVTMALSMASYHYIELNFLNLRKKFYSVQNIH